MYTYEIFKLLIFQTKNVIQLLMYVCTNYTSSSCLFSLDSPNKMDSYKVVGNYWIYVRNWNGNTNLSSTTSTINHVCMYIGSRL